MLQETLTSNLLLFAVPILISFLVGAFLIYINYARSIRIQKKIKNNFLFQIEKEKIKISRELHDAVTPFTLPLKEFIKKRGSFSELNEKEWLLEIYRFESYLSSINDNIFPAELLEGNLIEALQKLKQRFYTEKTKIELYTEINSNILKSNAIQIYRIIQECVINAVKYSESDLINIIGKQTNNDLIFFVSYKAPPKTEVNKPSNILRRGQKIISQRLELLSGKHEIHIEDNVKTEKFIFKEIFI